MCIVPLLYSDSTLFISTKTIDQQDGRGLVLTQSKFLLAVMIWLWDAGILGQMPMGQSLKAIRWGPFHHKPSYRCIYMFKQWWQQTLRQAYLWIITFFFDDLIVSATERLKKCRHCFWLCGTSTMSLFWIFCFVFSDSPGLYPLWLCSHHGCQSSITTDSTGCSCWKTRTHSCGEGD